MSVWSEVRGQSMAIEQLRKAVERGRLAHGYLFVGPQGVGKRLVAQKFAQAILCKERKPHELEACGTCTSCRPFLAGNHPDFQVVECPEGKREIPIDLLVGSKENRGQEGLCHGLSLKPLSGSRKIAIIDDAHLLNDAGANAILKTLEEPPELAVLILVASTLETVLPTIRSRCHLVRFQQLGYEDIEALLSAEGSIETGMVKEVSQMCDGSLSMAKEMLDPALWELRKTLRKTLCERRIPGQKTAQMIFSYLESHSSETSAQRESIQHIFRFVIDDLRRVIQVVCGAETREQNHSLVRDSHNEIVQMAKSLSPDPETIECFAKMCDRVMEASGQVLQNVNLSLCLEACFDDVSRMRANLANTGVN
ncbi:DNA-directed DNA polymerase [Planctopirus limnophila DSM 3776]|uniref:DNA-directed DNA polymerase n=1 Tax=Planctopirus limnophila (strain ATCC 43296 / DSM 3776 / IFAM 1008 / Mu 290) TaxID=521674 RepID=D5SVB5_PLAL2|nr:DNA polymerase III subunit delta' [Planctopirus limnophila]ADG67185.1 DNA-directed DNA polymerase [Planctopirus limnophila DSM 3776]